MQDRVSFEAKPNVYYGSLFHPLLLLFFFFFFFPSLSFGLCGLEFFIEKILKYFS